VPLILDPTAKATLEKSYLPGGFKDARLRMAHVPEGARLINNPVSAAAAWWNW